MFEFDVEREELRKPISELQKKYEKRLSQLLEKAKSDGELENALAVKSEMAEYKERDPEQAAVGFPELERLREIYARAYSEQITVINENLVPVVEAHKARLKSLQKTYTREAKLEKALAVKSVIDDLEKDTYTIGGATGKDPEQITAKSPDEVDPKNEAEFRHFITSNEFVLYFDPPRNKVVTFEENGRMGKGSNSWEFAWKIVDDELHLFSSDDVLTFALSLKRNGKFEANRTPHRFSARDGYMMVAD
ncbi:MAG: hypothetical protein WD342_09110 [Verrucomicrobiales bacterium]